MTVAIRAALRSCSLGSHPQPGAQAGGGAQAASVRWNPAAAAGDPGKAVCHSRHAETGKGETLEGKKEGKW